MRWSPDFLDMVRVYCEQFPGVLPEKWGWQEPLNRVFDAQNLEMLIPDSNECETIDWQRKTRPKAEGSFRVRWLSMSPKVMDTHASVNVTVELGDVEQDSLVASLKALSMCVRADFAVLEVLTESYRGFAMESGSAPYGDRFMLSTHVLRHWLPDVFWGTVFGAPYVKLFGKDRLLSAPVAIAEEIGEDMVYIQLTERLIDTVNSPSAVQQCRVQVKKHLGIDAFFESGRGYDRLKRGPVGDVFMVPQFELLVND